MSKKQSITIQDVANEAKVSKTTVSRYLNGRYEYMSIDTKKRIERTIQCLGFRPNKIANSLKTKKSGLIGVVISNRSTTLTPFLIGGICNELNKEGYNAIVINTDMDEEKEIQQVYSLLDHRVEGLIVGSGLNLDIYENINKSITPVVLVDRVPKECSLDSVSINHWDATTRVINNMIGKGYSRMGIVYYENIDKSSTIHARVKAAKEVFIKRFGNTSMCSLLPVKEDYDDDIIEKIQRYHELYYSDSKALFVANGQLFIRVSYCMNNLGINISERFALSGYDVWNMGELISPYTCTIQQPIKEMAEEATKLLISRIRNDSQMNTINKVIDCNINNLMKDLKQPYLS